MGLDEGHLPVSSVKHLVTGQLDLVGICGGRSASGKGWQKLPEASSVGLRSAPSSADGNGPVSESRFVLELSKLRSPELAGWRAFMIAAATLIFSIYQ